MIRRLELRNFMSHQHTVLDLNDGLTVLVGENNCGKSAVVSALQVLAIMKSTGKSLSELVAGMPRYPQTMINVRTDKKLDPGESSAIQEAVGAAEDELKETGRVVLRASGTEPVIRVMVEGENEDQVGAVARRLADVVEQAAG